MTYGLGREAPWSLTSWAEPHPHTWPNCVLGFLWGETAPH